MRLVLTYKVFSTAELSGSVCYVKVGSANQGCPGHSRSNPSTGVVDGDDGFPVASITSDLSGVFLL